MPKPTIKSNGLSLTFIALVTALSNAACEETGSQTQSSPSTLTLGSDDHSWYTFESSELCDESKGIHVSEEMLAYRGKDVLYDTVQTDVGDSVIISFNLISDCCLEFIGEAELTGDTLIVGFGGSGGVTRICDCYCEYRMTYRIDKRDRRWSAIKIVRGKLHLSGVRTRSSRVASYLAALSKHEFAQFL